MNYKEVEVYSNYIIYEDGRVWTKYYKKFLKKQIDKYGYVTILLRQNGKSFRTTLHRLLARHFITNPQNLPHVDHIDRNKLNNNLDNLRWVSFSENNFNKNLRKTNKLGLRYIHKVKNKNLYRIVIEKYNFVKYFKTKEEALLQRNFFLESVGEDYENIDV